MTQPPGRPPYDGYGSQPPQQPYPGAYPPPGQVPGQPPNPCPLSYIDMVGGKGIMTGVGAYRDENNFRMALTPMASKDVSDEDITFATVRRSGDDVISTWEKGGTDRLGYVGESSS